MQYIFKDQVAYNLHLIKTNKFKTITVRVVFSSPIVKEEITMRSVLSDILLQSTDKYSSRRNMIIEAENLYAVDIYNNTCRWGNNIMTSFSLQVLNDKYTEEGNLKKSIEFLSEIIFNPDVNKEQFKEDKLSLVKNNCEINMDEVKENYSEYALVRLKEAYDKNSPISYRLFGYQEDLDKINESNLYQYYNKMINSDIVDIFVVGDFNQKVMIGMIKDCFKFRRVRKAKPKYELPVKEARKRRLFAKEQINNAQSKLGIICPLSKMKPYDKNYPMVLANIILGGGPDSILFKEIREKSSLCYSIYSAYNKLDNNIIITAGIDKDNYDNALKGISDILDKMKKGKFTDNDISIAKELYNTAINTIEESPNNLINEYLTERVLGLESYNDRDKIMNNVTRREIVRAFKKIKMDTVFLLEGDYNEED